MTTAKYKIWRGSLLGGNEQILASGGTLPQSTLSPSKENPESGEWNLKKKVKRDNGLSQKKFI